jgi:hypothetical protein
VPTQLCQEAQLELIEICRSIAAYDRSLTEWALHESDDEFQSAHLVGGFEASEGLFTFSYFEHSVESWFDLPLETALGVARGEQPRVELRSPS